MPLPDWLLADLMARGVIHADGATRVARLQRCDGCGRPVLRGLDADVAALLVVCDTTEIDTRGELVALALGLRTYTITRSISGSGKSGWNLNPRYPEAIRRGQRHALVAAHRCGIAIPPAAVSRVPDWLKYRRTLPESAPF